MTLIEMPKPSRLRAFARAWWPVAAAVIVALFIAWKFQAAATREAEARRLAEAETLRQRGLVVVAQTSAKDIAAQVKEMTETNDALKKALENARKATGNARPVAAASASTGPVTAHGEAPAAPQTPAGDTAPSASPCLVSEGDEMEIRADEVVLETRSGNRVLVGTATAYRLNPLPIGPVFGGPFVAPLTEAAEVKRQERPAGWGAGVWAGVTRQGWAVGPAFGLPPVKVWRTQVEVAAGGGLGPGGEWSGGATALVRFR